MICEENGTAAVREKRGTHPQSWVTYRSISKAKDAKGAGAGASSTPSTAEVDGGSTNTDLKLGQDKGSSSSSSSNPDGGLRTSNPPGGIQNDDDDAQARAAIIQDPSFQREILEFDFNPALCLIWLYQFL